MSKRYKITGEPHQFWFAILNMRGYPISKNNNRLDSVDLANLVKKYVQEQNPYHGKYITTKEISNVRSARSYLMKMKHVEKKRYEKEGRIR